MVSPEYHSSFWGWELEFHDPNLVVKRDMESFDEYKMAMARGVGQKRLEG
jgi:hypothetical protein